MRKTCRPILVLVAIGIAATLLIAWGPALSSWAGWSQRTVMWDGRREGCVLADGRTFELQTDTNPWRLVAGDSATGYLPQYRDVFHLPPRWLTQADQFARDHGVKFAELYRCTVGWPFRCFEGFDYLAAPQQVVLRRGIDWEDKGPIEFPFVYRPMWLGLFLDVLVWSVLAASCWAMIAVVRRWPQKRTGRDVCESCGYSRSGLAPDAVCPECGKGIGA